MARLTIQLHNAFQDYADIPSNSSRNGHLNFKQQETGKAIRDLQAATGLDKGQAVAMLYPKRGSKARGLDY